MRRLLYVFSLISLASVFSGGCASSAHQTVSAPPQSVQSGNGRPADSDVSSQEAWRFKQPPVPAPRPVTPPSVQEFQLPNGLLVYFVEDHSYPFVVARLSVRAGSAADPPGEEGLARFVTGLLVQTTGLETGGTLADEVEELGTVLKTGATTETSYIMFDCLSEHFPAAIKLLARAVLEPRFPLTAVERLRKQTLTSIQRQSDNNLAVSYDSLRAAIFGPQHPYGHPSMGSEESLSRFTPGDAIKFYESYWFPSNSALIIVGDTTEAKVVSILKNHFRAWQPGKKIRRKPRIAHASGALRGRIIVLDRPKAVQASVALGHPGPSRTAADWTAVEMAGRILGGTYAARLNKQLVTLKGYAYVTYSEFSPFEDGSIFYVAGSFALDKTGAAIRDIADEIRGMRERPPSIEELQLARASLTQGLAANLQTYQQIAGAVEDLNRFRLPADYLVSYAAAVSKLTTDDVFQAARKYFRPDSLVAVVVGPADRLESQLPETALGPVQRESEGSGGSTKQ